MDSALPLSVAIITQNEEANLPRCLSAVRDLASEIVIVDSGSTDRTASIAAEFQARFHHHPWPGFRAQKNHALRLCTQPWVLHLDADEVVSPELARALKDLFAHASPQREGYLVNRRTFYLGDWIRHAWYPEWRLRLGRRESTSWEGRDPHPSLHTRHSPGHLKGDLLHYTYVDLQDHFETTLRYARISADRLAEEGTAFRWYLLLLSPWLAFLKHLFLRQGWRDGWRGWLISVSTGFSVFAKYAFLLERKLQHNQQKTPDRKDSPLR
ncbi:MAG TPA: glycosyltransferase family 2 protein [Methylomirabilota bacterium]|nr:glycosyltransferase family 2 protein [Methylomirabilota bacterium]